MFNICYALQAKDTPIVCSHHGKLYFFATMGTTFAQGRVVVFIRHQFVLAQFEGCVIIRHYHHQYLLTRFKRFTPYQYNFYVCIFFFGLK